MYVRAYMLFGYILLCLAIVLARARALCVSVIPSVRKC